MREPYKVVSLFAGIGGICQAFAKTNDYKIIWANEFDSKACETYRHNFPQTTLVEEDITKVKTKDIPEADVIVAGFPCQPFSLAGFRKGLEDRRGKLFMEITRIASEMGKLPRVLFLENVSNLLTHDGGKTYDFVEDTLRNAGYNYIHKKVMNTKDYSDIPQSRPRIYIIAFRDKQDYENFVFPDKGENTRSINDIINRSDKKPDKYYYSARNAKHFDDFVKEITDHNSIYQYRRVYVRKNKNNLCPTLTACMGLGGHNVPIIIDDFGIRKITPEECLMFQGFPTDFKFPDISDGQKYKQIGNAVTMPVVESIAKKIAFAMDKQITRNVF